ncbi:hypothetical protein MKW94_014162 [Papaver nudicaule]|uniref:Uncharacterized protein n=1 Tax=Papaver nudicaule TaxID=74823 RepID=A0AA41V873_PAPNU|nr:hypothetical protein [Papaver nudicaule]
MGIIKEANTSSCSRGIRVPCKSFGQKCNRLVKEQRARFYILRQCVTMLVCWNDCCDS